MKNENTLIILFVCFLYSYTILNQLEALLPELSCVESLMYDYQDSSLFVQGMMPTFSLCILLILVGIVSYIVYKYQHRLSLLAEDLKKITKAYKSMCHENERLSKREQYLFEKLAMHVLILDKLHKNPKYITKQQWGEIKDAVDLLYENFTERLKIHIPTISENDLKLCYLIKLGFSNTTIALLTGVTVAAITKRKQRMKEPMSEELKSILKRNHSFDVWLMKL